MICYEIIIIIITTSWQKSQGVSSQGYNIQLARQRSDKQKNIQVLGLISARFLIEKFPRKHWFRVDIVDPEPGPICMDSFQI